MYKTQLQELCHRRQWPLPVYAISREGPDHNPQFLATVTVNGTAFYFLEPSRSSKEAQSKAAQVAFEKLSSAPPPPPSPSLQLDFGEFVAPFEARNFGTGTVSWGQNTIRRRSRCPIAYKWHLKAISEVFLILKQII